MASDPDDDVRLVERARAGSREAAGALVNCQDVRILRRYVVAALVAPGPGAGYSIAGVVPEGFARSARPPGARSCATTCSSSTEPAGRARGGRRRVGPAGLPARHRPLGARRAPAPANFASGCWSARPDPATRCPLGSGVRSGGADPGARAGRPRAAPSRPCAVVTGRRPAPLAQPGRRPGGRDRLRRAGRPSHHGLPGRWPAVPRPDPVQPRARGRRRPGPRAGAGRGRPLAGRGAGRNDDARPPSPSRSAGRPSPPPSPTGWSRWSSFAAPFRAGAGYLTVVIDASHPGRARALRVLPSADPPSLAGLGRLRPLPLGRGRCRRSAGPTVRDRRPDQLWPSRRCGRDEPGRGTRRPLRGV